jgi:uncharacterized membrane-anchored protein
MQTIHNPRIDLRYWACISLVSVFGTNTGDLAVRYFRLFLGSGFPQLAPLGHAGPLPFLMALALLVFLIERVNRTATEFYFWTIILIIRTAATNIGDLLVDDFHFQPVWLTVVMACLLIFSSHVWAARRGQEPLSSGKLASNWLYWTCMLLAGVLGTIFGDFLWQAMGLATATLFLFALMAALVVSGYRRFLLDPRLYWIGIVMARVSGTAIGDWLAHSSERGGAGLGLPVATIVSGLAFMLCVVFWRTGPKQ